ncbi:hypothetical protein FBUS_10219 [Fasciolopsis buskii]|uniref:Uncharacterized protein n=1 Tax=Fasciolopsis buskii TaxID=27845 RepID=A0A8E0RR76_9TREM|nr:hypothetical protein FBUS_10219 [Fasciolopsis buski]
MPCTRPMNLFLIVMQKKTNRMRKCVPPLVKWCLYLRAFHLTKSVLLKMGKMTIRTWKTFTVTATKVAWLHPQDVLLLRSTRPTIPLILEPPSTVVVSAPDQNVDGSVV